MSIIVRGPVLKTFQVLDAVTAFRRRHMPFVQTLEDVELLRNIGLHQAEGDLTTMKMLYSENYASVPTIQRRLKRLRDLGVVKVIKSEDDKRVVRLTLGAEAWRDYGRLGKLMRKIMASP